MIMIMASLDNVHEDRAQVAGGGYISKEESKDVCCYCPFAVKLFMIETGGDSFPVRSTP